ncbi:MAG: hypothetical protein LBR79_05840 [Oscillospiraceae bacterium]|jgi:hypothetical protein|nr:hypothetical protein [Oscillospiraceae bacterium]
MKIPSIQDAVCLALIAMAFVATFSGVRCLNAKTEYIADKRRILNHQHRHLVVSFSDHQCTSPYAPRGYCGYEVKEYPEDARIDTGRCVYCGKNICRPNDQ